jgi:hypothetical protein
MFHCSISLGWVITGHDEVFLAQIPANPLNAYWILESQKKASQ